MSYVTASLPARSTELALTNVYYDEAGDLKYLTRDDIVLSTTASISATVSLDQAYDATAAGAGAIVTVDKQAVQLRTTSQSTFALVITGALAVGSGSAYEGTEAPFTGFGDDVLCWLSGVAGSQATGQGPSNPAIRGTTLVSGDLACSGTFIYPSASVGYINIPACGFFNASSMQYTPAYGNTGTATSYFSNPGTQQGSLQAAVYGLPPGCTLDQIELHQSRSATQAGQLALFRFQNNATTHNHEHIASKTYTQKGNIVITTLDNLSHSVASKDTANQFSYHIVVISGQSGAPPGASHRTYGAKVRYTYKKLFL